jgi:hypothetical protein
MKGVTNMAEPSPHDLLNYVDAAIAFYERVTGYPGRRPTVTQVQRLLAICGVNVSQAHIRTNLETIAELEQAEEQQETPPGDYGWPYFSSYLLPGRPTEKKE